MRRLAVTALLSTTALAAAGCGSSSHRTASAPATTAAPTTTQATTVTHPKKKRTNMHATKTTPAHTIKPATTTVAAPPPPTTATAKQQKVIQESVCPSEQGAGIVAVFGHRRSIAQADVLAAKAKGVGFQNLLVQRRTCSDYAVVLTGLVSVRQGKDLRAEAKRAGFKVTIECRSYPPQGGLAAVFGHRRTKIEAEALMARAQAVGFQGLRVQQDKCNDWEVDLYGIKTPAARKEFVAEARKAGFHIHFEPG